MSDVDESGGLEFGQGTPQSPALQAGNTEKTLAPKLTAIQPPTGPAPIEYVAPPSYDETLSAEIDPETPAFKSLYVTREEFEALLDRIDKFNNRSSQKI